MSQKPVGVIRHTGLHNHSCTPVYRLPYPVYCFLAPVS